MKTEIRFYDPEKEIKKEYEHSAGFVFLLGFSAIVLFFAVLWCITAGVTAIFTLIFPNIQ